MLRASSSDPTTYTLSSVARDGRKRGREGKKEGRKKGTKGKRRWSVFIALIAENFIQSSSMTSEVNSTLVRHCVL